MRLKRVKVFGFKTFADRTEFDLNGSLVAIFGPNGCGKSNIVDAILWALGEANARHLRAQTTVDVIFNGSAKRKPLGYAEVTLIFDNEDGALPIESAEVSVTRRITRAGESTYQINKRNCRLKDVYDLLADSGLGRAGYSIVGQREIDQALRASDEDRRMWIDEAAGVQRFRQKRTEAVRRLDDATEHLNRVDAILQDLEFQREPLEEEAKLAAEYLRIKEGLVDLESGLLVSEVGKATDELSRIEQSLSDLSNLQLREQARVIEADTALKAIGEVISELERKLDANRELRQSQISMGERAESESRLLRQKLVGLDTLEESLKGAESESRVEESRAELQELTQRLTKARAILADHQNTANAANAKLEGLVRTKSQAESELKQAKRVLELHQTALLKAEQAATRANELRERIAELTKQQRAADERVRESLHARVAQEDQFDRKQREAEDLRTERRQLQEGRQEGQRAHQALLRERAALTGKRAGIQATLDSHEGLTQGSHAVMSLVKSGELPAIYVPIAEAFSTDSDYALAIETALGGAAHDLIVPHSSDAERAIQLLKTRQLGRATFQPLNRVRGGSSRRELESALQSSHVIGIASELVVCAEEFRPVAESLLGRVLVVDTLENALKVPQRTGWSRLITLDGEVIHSAGAVSGGKSKRQAAGMISRRAELADIDRQIELLQTQLDQLSADANQFETRFEGLRQWIETRELELTELDRVVREARGVHQSRELEAQSLAKELSRLGDELARLAAAEVPESTPVPDIEALELARDQASELLTKHAAEVEFARSAARSQQEHVRELEASSQTVSKRIVALEDNARGREIRLLEIAKERQQLQELAKVQQHEAAVHRARAEEIGVEIEALNKGRAERLQASLDLNEALRRAEAGSRDLHERGRQLEIERARFESKRASAMQRMTEEYGVAESEVLSRYQTLELPPEAAAIVNRLRRDLRGLGTVNLGAIEAYDRLTERYTELDIQRTDISRSKEEIMSAMRELERLTKDRFLQVFAAIQVEFQRTFQHLFEGGTADIRLTQPDHVLTTGVEIEVQIPGKKRQKLELLSGGERSLCACAFLFALLKVKPSPLVVLDEVDAPLDGRNVERYVEVLKSLPGTQFVVITHNPVTIEAASVWFGVTMQEPGVTIILPYAAPETQTVAHAVVNDSFLSPSPIGG